ncbi:MAG: hypothetical protein CUN55_04555 [Phototrophicales bacterium]|nr:MAG: hypothetical protein CUN55_04555 [Phototrophicales bacterium]
MGFASLSDMSMASSREEREKAKQLYQELLADIKNMADDKAAEVRAAVITVLGDLADKDGIETVQAALKDDDAEVRKAAVEALGKLAAATMKSARLETPNRLI